MSEETNFKQLEALLDDAEACAFEDWLSRTCPSGDVTDVQNQWVESYEFSEFCEKWSAELDVLRTMKGNP